MNTSNIYKQSFVLLTTVIILAGCYKPRSLPMAPGGNYVLALRTQGASGTSDYVLSTDTINKENKSVSATGNGFEQLAWSYYNSTGSTIFSFSYGTVNAAVAYAMNESGTLYEKGRFSFERMDCFAKGDDSTLVAIGAPWGGGSYDCQIQLISANTVGIKKKRLTPIYRFDENDMLNKWPSSMVVNDGKLYIAFYPLDGVSWETQFTDTAYIAVFSYPGLDSLTLMKDSRTGPIGYYGNPVSMVKAENGDIYTLSPNSYAAGYTQSTKKSGILRIKNGQQSFDPGYFFDVESASGGSKVLSATYAGDGMLVATVVSPGVDDPAAVWAAFDIQIPICKLVVIDLNNKTVTDVKGVPAFGGQYGAQTLVENGKVYLSITSTTAGEARIYAVDPLTATAEKGAKIEGVEVPAIFKMN